MPEHIARIVPIAILTMLRRGEILGLRDVDIDFEAGAIASLLAAPGRRTRLRRRRAPVGARSIVGPAALRLLREQQLARTPNPDGLLFPNPAGTPTNAHNFMTRESSSPPPATRACPS